MGGGALEASPNDPTLVDELDPAPGGVRARRGGVSALPIVVAVAIPWLWFLVRDRWAWFDAVAIALPVLASGAVASVLLLAMIARRARRICLWLAASTMVAGAVAIIGPWVPQGGGAPTSPLRIASANVLFNTTEPEAGAASIIATDADVAVVVEVTAPTAAPMSRAYPYESATPDVPDEVVYSRWPIVDVRSLPGDLEGFGVRAVVERPEGRFVVYGIHTFRPWIDDSRASISVPVHRSLIRDLAELAAAERLPTVVAGDLNLVDRSSGYRLLDDRMRDAVRTSWAGPTSLKGKFLPLLARIDHIFVSEDWCADGGGRFDIAGSDHRGVVATIGPCSTRAER